MLSPLLNQTTLPVLEQAVSFAQARHGVLAGNIANIDTPGYKTRDLSPELFQQSLRRAIDQRDEQRASDVSPGLVSSRDTTDSYDNFAEVRDTTRHLLYHDDSDVSLEAQVSELAKNQSMHNMAIGLLTQQFRLLESAIAERVA